LETTLVETTVCVSDDGAEAGGGGQIVSSVSPRSEVMLLAASMDAHVPSLMSTYDSLPPVQRDALWKRMVDRFRSPPISFPFAVASTLIKDDTTNDTSSLPVPYPVLDPFDDVYGD